MNTINVRENQYNLGSELEITRDSNPTNTPSEILRTEQPVPTSAARPMQTKLPKEIESTTEFITNLLDYTKVCKFPCYWGIVPGETSITDVRNRFEPIAYSYIEREGSADITIQVEKDFSPPAEFIVLRINFDESGFVTDIYAPTGVGIGYGVSDLLSLMGEPDRVYIDTSAAGPKESFAFRYLLYYGKLNLIAMYLHSPSMDDSNIQFCPSNDDAPLIFISDLANEKSFMDVLRRFYPSWTNSYGLLEELSNYDPLMFYETYREGNDDPCMLISQSHFDIW